MFGDVCELPECGFSWAPDASLRPAAAHRAGTRFGAAGPRPARGRTGDGRGAGGGQRERHDITGVQAGRRGAHYFPGGLQAGERSSCLPLELNWVHCNCLK